MIECNTIYKSNGLKASLISAIYRSDHWTQDYNPRTSLSFPIKSAYRYRAGKFDSILDTNSILFEANNTEFSVYKYPEFQKDITLTIQFCDSEFDVFFKWIRKKNSRVDVFRRTPEIEFLIRSFLSSCTLNEQLLADQLIMDLLFKELIIPMIPKRSVVKIMPWNILKIDQAKEFIHDQSSSNLSLKEIAASCFTSPFYFSRVFKKETGYSPYKYLMHLRIAKAKQILKKSSVTSTAFEVGYNSLENFSYAFKKIVGLSPLHYQKSNISKV